MIVGLCVQVLKLSTLFDFTRHAVIFRMVKTRDKDSLSLAASAIWSGDHWFPDSSIAVDPPLLTSRLRWK